ncbi:unnamed protein product, partial [Candidula unifasciata]
TQCPEGSFGLECDQSCGCAEDEICNIVSGVCAAGCANRKRYGFNCIRTCSTNCFLEACFYRTGMCLQCQDGYGGPFCDTDCQPGTFGQRCASNCSKHCRETCNIHNGECSCHAPYRGPQCTECPPGTFGPNCTDVCPTSCKNHKCHQVSGMCLSCTGGRFGPFCQDCPNGLYGRGCYRTCSVYCLKRTCESTSGNCPVCTDGYTGPQCIGTCLFV